MSTSLAARKSRKLANSRQEMLSLMMMCEDPESFAKLRTAINDVSFYTTSTAREAYTRITERIAEGNFSKNGVVSYASLVADDKLSEATRERLEKVRKLYHKEKGGIDIREVTESMVRMWQLRQVNELIADLNYNMDDPEVELDPFELVSEIEERVMKIKTGGANNVAEQMYSFGTASTGVAVIKSLMDDNERRFVPTGFKVFDDMNGGFNYGSLVVIGGSTGGGKSTVVQNLLQNMAMYDSVCIVPLEMTQEEMVARMIAREAQIPVHRIMAKKWSEADKDAGAAAMKRWHQKVKKQGNKFTIFRPEVDMTIEEILAVLQPTDHRVIAIDYISLLKGADGEDSWQKLSQIARYAKQWATANNRIVILLAQVDDAGKVRYSRAILEHANNAWIFVADAQSKEAGIIQVTQPKARNQRPDPFDLQVDYEHMTVLDSYASDAVADDDDNEAPPKRAKRGNDEEGTEGKGKRQHRASTRTGGKGPSGRGGDYGADRRKAGGRGYFDNLEEAL